MNTLKDIRKMLNEPRPLTDAENQYKFRKRQMRKDAKAHLRVANLPFKPSETIQTTFETAKGEKKVIL